MILPPLPAKRPRRRRLSPRVVLSVLAGSVACLLAPQWLPGHRQLTDALYSLPGTVVIVWLVGYAVVTVLRAGLYVLAWPAEHARTVRRRRLYAGRCPTCDYDLRSSPERCPECGWWRPSPELSADEYAAQLHRFVGPPTLPRPADVADR